jgi:hypothetical protein
MTQHDAVVKAMKENGGYATFGRLYQTVLQIPDCTWGTKTPFASIRRIVQKSPAFFRIKPGLWGLTEHKETVLKRLSLDPEVTQEKVEVFNHTYYQGLILEIGNIKGYNTWIPDQDKNKTFLEKKLSEIASLTCIPLFTYKNLVDRARTIDVIWFNKRGFPDSFFEVEHSTNIYNSLLKYVEFQDFRVKLYIVADATRRGEFKDKLSSNAFVPIQDHVRFIDYKALSHLHAKVAEVALLEKALNIT